MQSIQEYLRNPIVDDMRRQHTSFYTLVTFAVYRVAPIGSQSILQDLEEYNKLERPMLYSRYFGEFS